MASSGADVTYKQLDERSNQFAWYLRRCGLLAGERIVVLLENHASFYQVIWGAQRSGIIYTTLSPRSTVDELMHVFRSGKIRLLVTSMAQRLLLESVQYEPGFPAYRLVVDGQLDGFDSLEAALASQPRTPVPDETSGWDMLYSSGSSGRPKAIAFDREPFPIDAPSPFLEVCQRYFGFHNGMRYLSPAPLYHAAPLRMNMAVMRMGGTSVLMDHFDPEQYLELIERHRVTHTNLVPTMLVRLLKLPAEVRDRYDLSSLRYVLHASAPCPPEIKERMIQWWGPIIWEFYAGTEGNGLTLVNSADWLSHRGTVGKAVTGILHICDDEGDELSAGQIGTVYFEGASYFKYEGDPEKTAQARNRFGWTTLGDVGYLDAEGFLYLTDRKSYLIISGGVNIYPQEVEDILISHSKVLDAAVFGIPNEDMGEEVKAVVQPRDMDQAGPELALELLHHLRQRIASYKCPRSIDFVEQLPREANGKLYKRLLRDPYWEGRASKLV